MPVFTVMHMIPVFQVFNRTFSIYMLTAVVGLLTTMFVMMWLARKIGLDEIRMLYLTLWSYAASFVGGALLYGAIHWQLLFRALSRIGKQPFHVVFDGLLQVFGGSVFYGGLIGVILTLLICLKKWKLSRRYADVAAIGMPLFHFFGRIGCFLGGCCFGIESHFGFVYHNAPIEIANGVRRFPVQLLEAAFNLCLVLLFSYMLRRGRRKGQLLNAYLYAYPTFRFFDEFLRGDDYRGFLWGLSTSQWISLLLIAGNTVFLLCNQKKGHSPIRQWRNHG